MRPTDERDSSRVSEPDTSALTPGIVGYRIGDIEVHLGRVIATRQGEVLSLPPLSFDLLIALAQLNILGLRGGVMLDDEALKSRYIIRQSIDIEHAYIIPAASDLRAAFGLLL